MEAAAYRRLQNAWITSNTGSSMEEPLIAISPLPFMIFISCTASKRSFIQDFLFIVVPVTLNFTTFSSNVHVLPLVLTFVTLINFTFSTKPLSLPEVLKSKAGVRPAWITNFRACTQLATVICIFAVDLNIFPRKFAKTEVDGFGAMDLGVGFYVICSGLVFKKNAIKKELTDIAILCSLGLIRLISIRMVDYQEHVTEYGVHWNFFFTLAFCRFINVSFVNFLKCDFSWLTVLFCVVHHTILSSGVQDWVTSSRGRDNFLDANREGISSALGYVILFNVAVIFKHNIIYDNIKRQLLKTLVIASSAWACTHICGAQFGASRRLCNLGYIAWTAATAASLALLLMIVDTALFWTKQVRVPPLMAVINRNGLLFFLVGNISTGLINLSIQTLLLSTIQSYAILFLYILIVLCIIYYGLNFVQTCKSKLFNK